METDSKAAEEAATEVEAAGVTNAMMKMMEGHLKEEVEVDMGDTAEVAEDIKNLHLVVDAVVMVAAVVATVAEATAVVAAMVEIVTGKREISKNPATEAAVAMEEGADIIAAAVGASTAVAVGLSKATTSSKTLMAEVMLEALLILLILMEEAGPIVVHPMAARINRMEDLRRLMASTKRPRSLMLAQMSKWFSLPSVR